MNENMVLSGRLGFLPLGDLIQLLGASGSTGVLRLINRYAPDPGFVYFVDGNPVNAQNGQTDGIDALYSLFGWVNGSFEFTRERILAERVITKSRMGIILEGMKRLDDGITSKIGPATGADGSPYGGITATRPGTIIKGPLVDYMYVVDEEDFFDGEHIVEEGKHGNWMWVILEGIVDIVRDTPSGIIPICRIGDGAFIGSMASFLLQGHIRNASAIAVGNVQLGVLDSQRLSQEYAGMPMAFRILLTSLDKRLKQVTDRLIAWHEGKTADEDILKDKKALIPQGTSETLPLYMIKQGRVIVVRETERGPVVLCQLYKGDYFGHLPFLQLGHEPDGAAIYASENIKITKVDTVMLHRAYSRLSTTFKNIVDNLLTTITVTSDIVCRAQAPQTVTATIEKKDRQDR